MRLFSTKILLLVFLASGVQGAWLPDYTNQKHYGGHRFYFNSGAADSGWGWWSNAESLGLQPFSNYFRTDKADTGTRGFFTLAVNHADTADVMSAGGSAPRAWCADSLGFALGGVRIVVFSTGVCVKESLSGGVMTVVDTVDMRSWSRSVFASQTDSLKDAKRAEVTDTLRTKGQTGKVWTNRESVVMNPWALTAGGYSVSSDTAGINLFKPAFQFNLTGLGGDGVSTRTLSTDYVLFGNHSIKNVWTSGPTNIYQNGAGYFVGTTVTTVTGSIYVRYADGSSVPNMTMYLYNTGQNGTVNTVNTAVGGGWYRCVGTKTLTAGTMWLFGIDGLSTAHGATYLCGWQVEQGSIATPYVWGTRANGDLIAGGRVQGLGGAVFGDRDTGIVSIRDTSKAIRGLFTSRVNRADSANSSDSLAHVSASDYARLSQQNVFTDPQNIRGINNGAGIDLIIRSRTNTPIYYPFVMYQRARGTTADSSVAPGDCLAGGLNVQGYHTGGFRYVSWLYTLAADTATGGKISGKVGQQVSDINGNLVEAYALYSDKSFFPLPMRIGSAVTSPDSTLSVTGSGHFTTNLRVDTKITTPAESISSRLAAGRTVMWGGYTGAGWDSTWHRWGRRDSVDSLEAKTYFKAPYLAATGSPVMATNGEMKVNQSGLFWQGNGGTNQAMPMGGWANGTATITVGGPGSSATACTLDNALISTNSIIPPPTLLSDPGVEVGYPLCTLSAGRAIFTWPVKFGSTTNVYWVLLK